MNSFLFVLFVFPALLVEACSSACLASFFSLSKAQIDSIKVSRSSKCRSIAHFMKNSDEVLYTLIIQNTIASILSQNLIATAIGNNGSFLINVLVPFLLTSIFAELLPKAIVIKDNLFFAEKFINIFIFFHKILAPFRSIALFFVNGVVNRISFIFNSSEYPSLQEQILALNTSNEANIISNDEKIIIDGFLRFSSLCVKDIILSHSEIEFFDMEDDISSLYSLIARTPYSQILVAKSSNLETFGVIDIGELISVNDNISCSEQLEKFIHEPTYIPSMLPCHMLISKFGKNCKRILFVINEYGAVCGFISCYNIIAAVIHNQVVDYLNPSVHIYETLGSGFVLNGMFRIDSLERLMKVSIENKMGQTTIGGLAISYAKSLPIPGLIIKIESPNLYIHILSVQDRRIKTVYVYK